MSEKYRLTDRIQAIEFARPTSLSTGITQLLFPRQNTTLLYPQGAGYPHPYPQGDPPSDPQAGSSMIEIMRYPPPSIRLKTWAAPDVLAVCIATGSESGVFAIDIDPDDGGDDSLRALEAAHGELPDTIQSLTGGGGLHYLFAWPDGIEIRNSASGALGVGIDVRGIGGQIVVAPTVHPGTGHEYRWEIEHDPFDGVAPAPAPAWLIELLTTAPGSGEPRRPERKRLAGDPLPGDWWESQTSWPDELVRHGWAPHSQHADSAGGCYELWTRPGKTVRDGANDQRKETT